MLDDRRKYALLLAQSLAFRMIQNLPDGETLSRVVIATEAAFPADDPLVDLIRAQARRWREICWNADALKAAGQTLLKQVERATWPCTDARMVGDA